MTMTHTPQQTPVRPAPSQPEQLPVRKLVAWAGALAGLIAAIVIAVTLLTPVDDTAPAQPEVFSPEAARLPAQPDVFSPEAARVPAQPEILSPAAQAELDDLENEYGAAARVSTTPESAANADYPYSVGNTLPSAGITTETFSPEGARDWVPPAQTETPEYPPNYYPHGYDWNGDEPPQPTRPASGRSPF
jgi:hypothetical protein